MLNEQSIDQGPTQAMWFVITKMITSVFILTGSDAYWYLDTG